MDAVTGGTPAMSSTAVPQPVQQQYNGHADDSAVQQHSAWADDAFMAAVTAMGLNQHPTSTAGVNAMGASAQAGSLPVVQEGTHEGQEGGIDEEMQVGAHTRRPYQLGLLQQFVL
jgi:hypothetical protein